MAIFEFRVQAKGVDELARHYRRAPEVVRREQLRAMEESLLDSEREVVQRTPTNKRRTGGRLRNAIRAQDAKTILVVGSTVRGRLEVANVPYVLWVEGDTKPHIIRAKNGKALAFSPTAGFQQVWRSTNTGKVYRTQAKAAAAGGRVLQQRGRALYRVQYHTAAQIGENATVTGLQLGADRGRYLFTRTGRRGTWAAARRVPKGGGVPERLVAKAGPATMIFRTEVHHPGTKGQHMFERGAAAAWPSVQRRWQAASRRVARYLGA